MTIRRCPCCGSSLALKKFCERRDVLDLEVTMLICSICTAIINGSQLDKALADQSIALTAQETSSRLFYDVQSFLTRKQTELENAAQIIQFMFDHASAPIGRKRAIDLGAGLGYMAAAACQFFDEAWALEINRWTLDQVIPHYRLGARLQVGSSLNEVVGQADAVFMWHTLEHIPNAWEIGRSVSEKIREGGVLFWQVPLYHDSYIFDTHFTFFNSHSATVFNDSIGLQTEGIWFDQALQFMTVLGRKSV